VEAGEIEPDSSKFRVRHNTMNEIPHGFGSHSRIAVFGGIYNNYLALQALVLDARSRGAEKLFCLGDLGAFGPHPNRVFPILFENDIVVVKGNYDDSVGRDLRDCQCGYTDPRDNHFAKLSYDYTHLKTSDEYKPYLRSLPEHVRFRFGRRRLLLCHGSPRRMNEFLWESTTPDHFLEKVLSDFHADVVLATHTGIHWKRDLPGGRTFANVGVIGRPENEGKTHVWYALLTAENDVEIEFVPLEYDYERLAAEMAEEDLPVEFIETILSGWWTTCLEVLPAKERRRGRY
jgi:predicted phosphodiesterase